MSRWTLCKRRDFIRRLRKIGFVRMMTREVEEIIGRKIAVDEWNKL
ncbi:MAG: hypothetical protein WBW48_06015 [Anaerolineae bacterium]